MLGAIIRNLTVLVVVAASVASVQAQQLRALVIGIDDYPGTVNDLTSCVNDMNAVSSLLKDRGFTSIVALRDSAATLEAVRSKFKELSTGLGTNDRLVLFCSSHGTPLLLPNGKTEEFVCLYDGLLQDDELVKMGEPLPKGILTVVLDCCYAGGDYRGPIAFQHDAAGRQVAIAKNKSGTVREELPGYAKARKSITQFNVPDDEAGQPHLNGILLAACKEEETAAAGPTRSDLSAFTQALITAAREFGASASVRDVAARIGEVIRRNGWQQTPQAKGEDQLLASTLFQVQKATNSPNDITSAIAALFDMKAHHGAIDTKGPNSGGALPLSADSVIYLSEIVSKCIPAQDSPLPLASKTDTDKLFGIDDAILIPAIASVVTAAINKRFSNSGGGAISVPGGGVGIAFSASDKGQQKIFGIDDAILIPAVISVVTAAITKEVKEKQLQATPGSKLFGIDDAILIPAIASVVTAAINKRFSVSGGGQVSVPGGSGGFAFDVSDKSHEKIFGIDDAILIPALVSVVTAAITKEVKEKQLQATPGSKLFGIDDAILIPAIASVVTAAINKRFSNSGGEGFSLPEKGLPKLPERMWPSSTFPGVILPAWDDAIEFHRHFKEFRGQQ